MTYHRPRGVGSSFSLPVPGGITLGELLELSPPASALTSCSLRTLKLVYPRRQHEIYYALAFGLIQIRPSPNQLIPVGKSSTLLGILLIKFWLADIMSLKGLSNFSITTSVLPTLGLGRKTGSVQRPFQRKVRTVLRLLLFMHGYISNLKQMMYRSQLLMNVTLSNMTYNHHHQL